MITLDDLEERYTNIRKLFPDRPKCAFSKCNNPADMDTTCAYHRLLFDHWMYEVVGGSVFVRMTQRGRRNAFTRWVHKLGPQTCDAIVLDMAQDAINWEC